MRAVKILPFAGLLIGQHMPLAAAESSDSAIIAFALPEAQFRGILARAVFGTQTIRMGVMGLGPKGNCAVLVQAFNAAVAKDLPAWSTNLVRAYRQNVPADVLEKASAAGSAEASAPILQPYLNAVGEQMQKDSEPLLTAAASEVIEPVFDATSQVDIATLNMETRQAEVKAAMADGSLTCGLLSNNGKQS